MPMKQTIGNFSARRLDDHSMSLTTYDFAWEFLRRDMAFVQAFANRQAASSDQILIDGRGYFEMQHQDVLAETWGLYSFRGSCSRFG